VFSDSKRIADHIDHIVKIAGVDYVGLGSDFDGVGPTQPTDVQDVSGYPVIVCELLKRGYSEKDIKKILSGNFFRVWNEVIKIADTLSKSSGPASPVASNDKEEGRTLNRRVELVKQ
jgi:membrane dipeptidase